MKANFKTHAAKLIMFIAVIMPLVFIGGCDKDDDHDHNHNNNNHGNLDYHAHIHSPDSTDKHVNDTIHIHVEFTEHNNDKVHNFSVRIFNRDSTAQVVYSEGDHVHADAKHEHHDMFILSNANGVSGHTNWTLEAKVWGHDSGESAVVETVDFHVHP